MAESYDRFEDIKATMQAYADFASGDWQRSEDEKCLIASIEEMFGATLLEVMAERLYERVKEA